MKHTLWSIAAAIVVGSAVLSGCSRDEGLPRQAIEGTVTLDGKPLGSGTIAFMPTDPSGPSTAVEVGIAGGAYRIPPELGLVPGSYRVVISAPVPAPELSAGKAAGGRGAEATGGTGVAGVQEEIPLRESVPAKYNARSTLKADVTEGGKNVFDFPLTSR